MNVGYQILIIVSQCTRINIEAIKGKSRYTPIKIARQLVHYYAFKKLNNLTRAAELTNNNHATVYNSIARVRDWANDEDYKNHIIDIEKKLKLNNLL